jgi:hypothetical protein
MVRRVYLALTPGNASKSPWWNAPCRPLRAPRQGSAPCLQRHCCLHCCLLKDEGSWPGHGPWRKGKLARSLRVPSFISVSVWIIGPVSPTTPLLPKQPSHLSTSSRVISNRKSKQGVLVILSAGHSTEPITTACSVARVRHAAYQEHFKFFTMFLLSLSLSRIS